MTIEQTNPAVPDAGNRRDWFSEWPTMVTQRWPELLGGRLPELFESGLGRHAIRVEEHEEEGRLVIRAELPDVDPESDVDITVADHRLHVRARREQRSEVRQDDRFRSEFSYGSFERTLPLPPTAAVDDVDATYRDGILEIRVPLRSGEEAGARRVPIGRG